MRKKILDIKNIICIAILLLSGLSIHAQNIDTLFSRGTTAYKNGDYKTAAESYQTILSAGYHSAELYNNLGNAYYRLGYIAPTILAYERAALLDPSDKDIEHNLTLARRMTTDNIVPLGTSLTSRVWEAMVGLFDASTWGIITIVCLWITGILFVMFIYGKSVGVRRTSFYLFIISIALSSLFYAMNRSAHNRINQCPYAIITATNVTVKSEPSNAGGDAFSLHEGAKFAIEETLDGWYKIRLADGKTGWLPLWAAEKI